MRDTAPLRTIAVECDNCGHTTGHMDLTRRTRYRCDECGRFAPASDSYCADHDIRYDTLPGDGCPACREERAVAERRCQRLARDRTVEPF